MRNPVLFLLISFLVLGASCGDRKYSLSRIEARQVNINDSLPEDPSIKNFIAPYKEHLDREMDSVLAVAPQSLRKTDGDLNTAIGNMMADAVMELSDPVFRSRTGKKIDLVLLNHGGIRASINKGDITTRTAYQLMPFENEVVVASLKGEQVRKMVNYLVKNQTPHPIAGMKLEIDSNNRTTKALVQGKPIENEKIYFVATNDYLYNGGDNMSFFAKAEAVINLDYKIRNLLIDYFKIKDTISPVTDGRFIRN